VGQRIQEIRYTCWGSERTDFLDVVRLAATLLTPSEQKLHWILVIPARTFNANCFEQTLLIKEKHSAGAVDDAINQATSSSAETRALIEQRRSIRDRQAMLFEDFLNLAPGHAQVHFQSGGLYILLMISVSDDFDENDQSSHDKSG
jgi:hypothetical protein